VSAGAAAACFAAAGFFLQGCNVYVAKREHGWGQVVDRAHLFFFVAKQQPHKRNMRWLLTAAAAPQQQQQHHSSSSSSKSDSRAHPSAQLLLLSSTWLEYHHLLLFQRLRHDCGIKLLLMKRPVLLQQQPDFVSVCCAAVNCKADERDDTGGQDALP
jgi:hypothetical protein